MTLAQFMTPESHQNVINRLDRQHAAIKNLPGYQSEAERILAKIQWHAEQYTLKTNQLPK